MAEDLKGSVKAKPGLVEMLENDGEPPSTQELEDAVREFRQSTGLEDAPLRAEPFRPDRLLFDEDFAHEEAKETGGGDGKRGRWQELKDWWNEVEHNVVATEVQPIQLAAFWLTLPTAKGATVTVSSSHTDGGEVAASLMIAGIGGGPSFTLTVTDTVSFESEVSERALLTASGTFEKVEVKRHDEVVDTYTRLKALDGANLKWGRVREEPPAVGTLGTSIESQEYECASAGGSTTQESTVAKGTSWEIGAEVKLWGSGLKLGGKLTYEREVTYVNKLPAGQNYKATRYAAFPARIWEVVTG
jgi:hypothetical protein